MSKKWFRRKQYGWGWYPATWQGWLILAEYCAFLWWNYSRIDQSSHSDYQTMLSFIPETFVATVVLIWICYLTGESPRWQWGKKSKN